MNYEIMNYMPIQVHNYISCISVHVLLVFWSCVLGLAFLVDHISLNYKSIMYLILLHVLPNAYVLSISVTYTHVSTFRLAIQTGPIVKTKHLRMCMLLVRPSQSRTRNNPANREIFRRCAVFPCLCFACFYVSVLISVYCAVCYGPSGLK